MRTTGSQTKKACWNCMIKVNNQDILNMNFPSLSKIAEELGLSRNIVNEIVNNRRKQRSGKYDTQYIIKKLDNIDKSVNQSAPAL